MGFFFKKKSEESIKDDFQSSFSNQQTSETAFKSFPQNNAFPPQENSQKVSQETSKETNPENISEPDKDMSNSKNISQTQQPNETNISNQESTKIIDENASFELPDFSEEDIDFDLDLKEFIPEESSNFKNAAVSLNKESEKSSEQQNSLIKSSQNKDQELELSKLTIEEPEDEELKKFESPSALTNNDEFKEQDEELQEFEFEEKKDSEDLNNSNDDIDVEESEDEELQEFEVIHDEDLPKFNVNKKTKRKEVPLRNFNSNKNDLFITKKKYVESIINTDKKVELIKMTAAINEEMLPDTDVQKKIMNLINDDAEIIRDKLIGIDKKIFG